MVQLRRVTYLGSSSSQNSRNLGSSTRLKIPFLWKSPLTLCKFMNPVLDFIAVRRFEWVFLSPLSVVWGYFVEWEFHLQWFIQNLISPLIVIKPRLSKAKVVDFFTDQNSDSWGAEEDSILHCYIGKWLWMIMIHLTLGTNASSSLAPFLSKIKFSVCCNTISIVSY